MSRLQPIAIAGVGCLFMLCSACNQPVHQSDGKVGERDIVTFNRDVAPIMFRHCSGCHRPGESAPFSLLNYEDVKRRSSQVAEVTRTRFMPPWLPVAGHGDFQDVRRLTDEEIQLLDRWVQLGTPEGPPSDLPRQPTWTHGWQLGEPDLVLESPSYTLAASGDDQFRNFVIPIPIDQPRWVRSVELRPLNPSVTHHVRLGVDRWATSRRRDAEDVEPGYGGMPWAEDPEGQLLSWTPGKLARPGTPGTAWRLNPEIDLVLALHLRPSGKPETVACRIGVYFAAEEPRSNPVILRSAGDRVLIYSAQFANTQMQPPVASDFAMTSLIPASYLPAGRLTFEDNTGVTIYWSLCWGGAGYTGPTIGNVANDADGNFGPCFGGPLPSASDQALQFTGVAAALSTNNAADYALTAGQAVSTNNAGASNTVPVELL